MTGRERDAVGPHRVTVEPPDIVHLVFEGDVAAEHVGAVLDAMERVLSKAGRVFVLQDLSRMRTFTPEARKLIAEDPRAAKVAAIASYNVSFHMRVVLGMLDRVHRLTRGKAPPSAFYASKEDALSWIAEERARPRRGG
jgi:hypothetical protein